MQQQYNQIKSQHPDEIVLFRLGDFYEAFNGDAELLSRVLGITLTGRGKNENRIPMAGIPFHALDNYLPKLVKAGHKVAIVEQLTEPKAGQIVERDVTKIYTAGTLTDENTLADDRNNYLVAVCAGVADGMKKKLKYQNSEVHGGDMTYGVAIADLSTGKLQVFETKELNVVRSELHRLQPAEIITGKSQAELPKELGLQDRASVRDDIRFDYDAAQSLLVSKLKVTSLKGFGIEGLKLAVSALGALVDYAEECNKQTIKHFNGISKYNFSEFMQLDINTVRNLELVFSNQNGDKFTLYSVLNQCQTNMGKRKLYDWILHPLLDAQKLTARWEAVNYFHQNVVMLSKLRDVLQGVADLERIIGRLGVGSGNARELLALKQSLQQCSEILSTLEVTDASDAGDKDTKQRLASRVQELAEVIKPTAEISNIISLIETAITQDPPATITDGRIIAKGYNTEVDQLRDLSHGGKGALAEIQAREIERTRITSLKVSYNNVFGYYIEITNSHRDKVPVEYIRKQTLTNAERYITPELKEWEDKVLTAEEKLTKLEYELFMGIRDQVVQLAGQILTIADALAELDVVTNFAFIAREYNYCVPKLWSSSSLSKPSENITQTLTITDGRHPIVERLQSNFTANNVEFGEHNFVLLTGPNMSGKSTYIRQVALIVLMAQIGSFVPASSMEFSIVDQIFTRVGASDNLSRGESTFMVEMHETANILHNATDRSLIILDEVGRGTSTYDGVAIAWAIVEFIIEQVRANTLFATHYHELIALAGKYHQLANYHVTVLEDKEDILFQHKIAPGSTSRSYGVHVAKMAGVPKQVVTRAEEILEKFETGSLNNEKPITSNTEQKPTSKPQSPKNPKLPKKISPEQLGLI